MVAILLFFKWCSQNSLAALVCMKDSFINMHRHYKKNFWPLMHFLYMLPCFGFLTSKTTSRTSGLMRPLPQKKPAWSQLGRSIPSPDESLFILPDIFKPIVLLAAFWLTCFMFIDALALVIYFVFCQGLFRLGIWVWPISFSCDQNSNLEYYHRSQQALSQALDAGWYLDPSRTGRNWNHFLLGDEALPKWWNLLASSVLLSVASGLTLRY